MSATWLISKIKVWSSFDQFEKMNISVDFYTVDKGSKVKKA